MELTKKDTKMLQGLSVLAMVWLHLFDTNNYQGLFQPLLFIGDLPVSFFLGQLSDFCVFGFAFCSGYAHMLLFEQKDYYKKRLKSLLGLLINYWIIVILFSIVSICMGKADQMPGNVFDFLGTIFLYNIHYNGAWWYMWVYAILIIISPIVLRFIKRCNPIIALVIIGVFYSFSHYLRVYVQIGFVASFGLFGVTLSEYLLGSLVFNVKYFTKIKVVWSKINPIFRYIIATGMFCSLFFLRTLLLPNLYFAVFSGFILVSLFVLVKKPMFIESFFQYIGVHSTNIWLTHMFFYAFPFVNLVYIMKYPPLVFLLMLLLTITVSYLIKLIQIPLNKLLR